MKVRIASSDPSWVRSLKEKYSLSLLAATILERRGVEAGEDVMYFLESDTVYLHSPFESDDIYTAVDRINDAIEENERILIFGDRDVDGVTATAIMARTLRKLGAENVFTRLPSGDEPYGLTSDSVSEILDKGYTLVITVDCGISSVEEIRALERNGVDVIVLDHHIPGEELPPAAAIFDPRVSGSGYPFESLAGCAVAAKTAWALFFSRTPLFGCGCILLHAEPRNGTIRINAVRLEDLVETDRITEEVVEGAFSIERTRLIDFLAVGLPVIVLDSDTELNMLRKAFGSGVDISLIDMRPQLEALMPSASGHSLFDLSARSRAARYRDGDREIETLVSLFRSVSIYSDKSLSSDFDDLLQFAAIGTIADLMPMKDENRIIVKRGLRMLSERPLNCFKYLMGKQNLAGKKLNTRDVSFYIAPVLNAAGRMGNPMNALSLLLSDDLSEAEGFTETLLQMNRERQKGEEDALEAVRTAAFESFEALGGKMVIISDGSIPRGLTGAIASKVSKQYSVPCIVMASVDGRISASMRCGRDFNARSFLSLFSDLFLDFGGHQCAAGFSMPEENGERFIRMAESYVRSMDEKEEVDMEITADADIPEEYMTTDLWKLYELLEPYGQENEELKFSLRHAQIYEIYPSRGDSKVFRFAVKFGRNIWPALWWTPHNREEFSKGTFVNLVFSPDINYWKGQSKMQMVIEEMELS